MDLRLIQAPTFLSAFLAAATFASDTSPGTLPGSPTKLAERTAGQITYTLRQRRLPRDQSDPNSRFNISYRLELQEIRAGEDRSIGRWSRTITRGNSEALPTACIGLSQEKFCVVLANSFSLSIYLADRSATTDLDQVWKEVSRIHTPKIDNRNHPTARFIRQSMHATSVEWLEIPGVTGEEAIAAWKAGTLRPISAEFEANTWLIKFKVGEKRFLGRFSEDKDGTVTWDARRED